MPNPKIGTTAPPMFTEPLNEISNSVERMRRDFCSRGGPSSVSGRLAPAAYAAWQRRFRKRERSVAHGRREPALRDHLVVDEPSRTDFCGDDRHHVWLGHFQFFERVGMNERGVIDFDLWGTPQRIVHLLPNWVETGFAGQ